jgi:integral membrane sensor domain MASE1
MAQQKSYHWLKDLGLILAVAAIYFLAAKLGLSLAFLNASVSPVWPPTGVAIAVVLWLGYRTAP